MENAPENVHFPTLEHTILERWDRLNIFGRSLEQTAQAPRFVFYDGPPFATGLPHYGHLLAGTIKDIIPRYWTMKGHHVERRFGWDCHGLPVEFEIEQELGLKGRKDIEAFGIQRFNHECRSIVLRYTSEWARTVRRIGRWVDVEHAYRTMDPDYMETIWWVFKTLWDKDLIYKGNKVLPYSTRCGTPLSYFEANLNYKDVQDPAITVSFPVEGEPDTHLLAWTTTPWTLTSNLALAVGPDIDYVKVRDRQSGRFYILARQRLASYYRKADEYEVIGNFKGRDLAGRRYRPLFDYFAAQGEKGAFRVIGAGFVSTEDGTGIVHIAPAFGEDDYLAAQAAGIGMVMPVDDDGCFTAEVPDHQGKYIKDCDRDIIRAIKGMGRLIHQATITHSYPFCYRSDTPLIYKAISTWFLRVEPLKERIMAHNQGIRWVPEHLRDGRFGKWLENARDWAISRNRFWGTPIPVWEDATGQERLCLGSRAELEKLAGRSFDDLHRECLDPVTLRSPTTGRELRRVTEVLDCWFESGSMPYAQSHYPFENKERFESHFPADFIGEGLDQTRGWFYTLLVISTALFDKTAFRNVVVNGLILAEDGKKMSKRLKNYPEPTLVLDQHGADALRLYMINSPVVRAEELRFGEAGVKDLVRRVLLPLWNSYRFFVTYALLDQWAPGGPLTDSPHILDRWILSRVTTLIQEVRREMDAYRLYSVVPALLGFIDELTDGYIRLNRRRFWDNDDAADKQHAYGTLFYVLLQFSKLLAPLAPFITEEIYLNLATLLPERKDSVHLEPYPEPDARLVDADLEDGVRRMSEILIMGRNLRTQKQIKVKIPLKTIRVIHRDDRVLEELRRLEPTLRAELNVRQVEYSRDEQQYVRLYAKPNFKVLGPRLGARFKAAQALIEALTEEKIRELESAGSIRLEDLEFQTSDIQVLREIRDVDAVQSNRFISVFLDCSVDAGQTREGYCRELVAAIQKMRKDAGYRVEDRIEVSFRGDPALEQAVEAHRDYLCGEVLCLNLRAAEPAGDRIETIGLDGMSITVGIRRAGAPTP